MSSNDLSIVHESLKCDETPLFKASRGGHLGVARLLLQYNADVHARDVQGQTPFQIASKNEHHEVMQLLLEHGGGDQRNAITSE